MSPPALRLLYLGFAFPPGIQSVFPNLNPAGHGQETQMIRELRRYFQIRSAGVLPVRPPVVQEPDPATGIEHELILLEKPPELYHRFVSLVRLKRQYRRWARDGWVPEIVLVYNLSPIYNQFVRWLARASARPRLVLMLLDSPNLGRRLARLKRLRRRLKPMYVPDEKMLLRFDACMGVSKATESYFAPRQVPFLWMPGACNADRAVRTSLGAEPDGPIRFGYFGALGAHAGVRQLIELFPRNTVDATLEICGYGKAAVELAERARKTPRVKFHGLLTADECLRFGRQCDVLVNPRPATHGNENNFASKLFEYALSGRAILTSNLSGAADVLGPDANYFDPRDFERSLGQQLSLLARTPRADLHRRGALIQERVLKQFSWEVQGRRLAVFLESVCTGRSLASAA